MKIAIYSNPPYTTSGYGQQTALIAKQFQHDGHDVLVVPNCGAMTSLSWQGIEVAVEGIAQQSLDAAPEDAASHIGDDGFCLILMDMWPLQVADAFKDIPLVCWTPVDHDPCPPLVAQYLKKPNRIPLAMSRFGQKALTKAGIEDVTFIPLTVDTTIFYDQGKSNRPRFNLPEDAFVVVTNAANRGNNPIRKGFGEMADVMKLFMDERQDVIWMIHTEYRGIQNGVNLPRLIEAVGIDKKRVLYPSPQSYRKGMSPDYLASLYSCSDCILALSYGEGFGIPSGIEAPACGCPAIVTDFTSQSEFITPYGRTVEYQRYWDEPQQSWYGIANIKHAKSCINDLYYLTKSGNVDRTKVRAATLEYDTKTVYNSYWKPFLKSVRDKLISKR
jgi:glycosyltransferase involved in cell wall biosynthesis